MLIAKGFTWWRIAQLVNELLWRNREWQKTSFWGIGCHFGSDKNQSVKWCTQTSYTVFPTSVLVSGPEWVDQVWLSFLSKRSFHHRKLYVLNTYPPFYPNTFSLEENTLKGIWQKPVQEQPNTPASRNFGSSFRTTFLLHLEFVRLVSHGSGAAL